MKKILLIILISFGIDCFGCNDTQENYVAFYKDWKQSKPNTFYLYVPRVKGEYVLGSIEIEYINSGATSLAVYAEMHDPSKYEENEWYKNYMAAVVKFNRENIDNLRVQAHYRPKDKNKVLKCDNKIIFTSGNMHEKL